MNTTAAWLRNAPTSSPGGGEVDNWQQLGTLAGDVQFYSRNSQFREEQATGQVAGPGATTRTQRVFIIDGPGGPAVAVNDRLQIAGEGVQCDVLFVRRYEESLQLDIEVVK